MLNHGLIVCRDVDMDALVELLIRPLRDQHTEISLLERDWESHLDVISPVLIELVDADAPVRVGRAMILEEVEGLGSADQREKLLDEDQHS
jgi:hypothetical protein